MSTLLEDIEDLTTKYQFREDHFDIDKLNFRVTLLQEELNEIQHAIGSAAADEVVDGLIDLVVVALGTLAIAGVDTQEAWDQVQRANMAKVRGIKPGREQSGGFDLVKPPGWQPPSHRDNTGKLEALFAECSLESRRGVR